MIYGSDGIVSKKRELCMARKQRNTSLYWKLRRVSWVLYITDTTESVDNELHEASQQQISVSEALNTTSVDPSLYKTIEAMKSEIDALSRNSTNTVLTNQSFTKNQKLQKAFGNRELKTRKPIISRKTRLPRTRTIAFEKQIKDFRR